MIIIAETRAGWSGFATDPYWSSPYTVPNFRHNMHTQTPEDWAEEVVAAIKAFYHPTTGVSTWPSGKTKNWTLQPVGIDGDGQVYGMSVLANEFDKLADAPNPPGTNTYVGPWHDVALLQQGVTLGTEA